MTESIPSPDQINQILKDMRKNKVISVTHVDGTKCDHDEICGDAKIISLEDME
jgi:hypothetical protein